MAFLCISESEVEDYASGEVVTVSGWGALETKGQSPSILQVVEVPFISTKTCRQRHVYGMRIQASMICAGKLGGGVDSCQGKAAKKANDEQNGFMHCYMLAMFLFFKFAGLLLKFSIILPKQIIKN